MPPSLSFVAGAFVLYLLARVLDRKGGGLLFLPSLVVMWLYGEYAIVPCLFAQLLIGAFLSVYEAGLGAGGKK